MSELFNEIQEDMRGERLDKLWRMFGKYIVGASVGLVLITILVVVFQNYNVSKHRENTAQYVAALENIAAKKYDEATKILDALIAQNHAGFADMAVVKKIDLLQTTGKNDQVKKELLLINGKTTAHAELAQLQTQEGKTVAPDKTSPFYYSENEFRAWKLLDAGKKDEALAIFKSLRDATDAPPSLRKRAGDAVVYVELQNDKVQP